jgi:hypothetical protein
MGKAADDPRCYASLAYIDFENASNADLEMYVTRLSRVGSKVLSNL